MAVTALALLALAGCGSDEGGAAVTSTPSGTSSADAAAAPTGSEPPADVPLLGVLDATAGTWEDDALTLTGVRPNGIWFTDRPARQAGTTPIDDLLPLFFTEDDPPNAAIEIATDDDGADVAIVELTDPQWDADAGELSFTATRIADPTDAAADHPGISGQVGRADETLPASFGPVTVFIDSGAKAGVGTTTTTANEVTPVADPSAADVQQLATDMTTLQSDLDDLLQKQRVKVDQDPTDCGTKLFQAILEVLNNVDGYLEGEVATLQAAVVDGQYLPASLLGEWEQAKSDLASGQYGLAEVTANYETDSCPV